MVAASRLVVVLRPVADAELQLLLQVADAVLLFPPDVVAALLYPPAAAVVAADALQQ